MKATEVNAFSAHASSTMRVLASFGVRPSSGKNCRSRASAAFSTQSKV